MVLSSEYLLLYFTYGHGFLTPRSSPHLSAEPLLGAQGTSGFAFRLDVVVGLMQLLLGSAVIVSLFLWMPCRKQEKRQQSRVIHA